MKRKIYALVILTALSCLLAVSCGQVIDPKQTDAVTTPEAVEETTPTVIEATESIPETTNPAPETTTPETTAPETTALTPETTVQVPETTVPTPETMVPTPETTVPTPETTVPTPETTVPTPETTVAIPETTEPTPEEGEISFNTLSVEGTNVRGEVSNATEAFSFADEITVSGNAVYVVSLDIYGMQTVITKTVSLESGDNTFYVIEQRGDEIKTYTVTIRRRPVYTVSFDTDGAGEISAQSVEEGSLATVPEISREGYSLGGWDRDFSLPITEDTVIKASWDPNTYTVTYDVNGGDALDASTQTVTYGEEITLAVPTRTGYTFDGWYNGGVRYDGDTWLIPNDTALSARWAINSYQITVDTSLDAGTVDGSQPGEYEFGSTVSVSVTSNYLGYTWLGWYDGEKLLTAEQDYTFELGDNDVHLIAKWKVSDDMADFSFTSTETTCVISKINDKTKTSFKIPDYVTVISVSAFEGSSATSITLSESLAYIGRNTFAGLSRLTSIDIPESVKYIDSGAFAHCNGLVRVTLPNTITKISGETFANNSSLESIIIPDGVTEIGAFAFGRCSSLTSITLPKKLTNIGFCAFDGCAELSTVYYGGTAADWANINIASDNDYLTSATRYYYSETRPTDAGRYWHYVDGIPTAW